MPGSQQGMEYRRLLDSLNSLYLRRGALVFVADPKKLLSTVVSNPSIIIARTRMVIRQVKSASTRAGYEREGLLIPHLLLLTITHRCNLTCSGCYMRNRQVQQISEMNFDEIRSVVSQARDLGVANIVILGGEPLLRWKEILGIARMFPDFPFLLFTNGLLLNDEVAKEMVSCSNVIPFISFDGFREETDARRGSGVFDRLLSVCALLNDRLLFFGCSVTVTRENIDTVLGEPFMQTLIGTGARAVTLIPFVPTMPGTDGLVLTPGQKRTLIESIPELSRKFPAVFVPVPGDVEVFGGCLAAGRGFIHVTPTGDLEPCAMVPYSDANLKTVPLKEALRSPFLAAIRKNHGRIKPDGHCALRTDRKWVQELFSSDKR